MSVRHDVLRFETCHAWRLTRTNIFQSSGVTRICRPNRWAIRSPSLIQRRTVFCETWASLAMSGIVYRRNACGGFLCSVMIQCRFAAALWSCRPIYRNCRKTLDASFVWPLRCQAGEQDASALRPLKRNRSLRSNILLNGC